MLHQWRDYWLRLEVLMHQWRNYWQYVWTCWCCISGITTDSTFGCADAASVAWLLTTFERADAASVAWLLTVRLALLMLHQWRNYWQYVWLCQRCISGVATEVHPAVLLVQLATPRTWGFFSLLGRFSSHLSTAYLFQKLLSFEWPIKTITTECAVITLEQWRVVLTRWTVSVPNGVVMTRARPA
jgi:hypothetical protein